MIIELIGCTSSGKSTLLKKIVECDQVTDREVISAEALVLELLHLSWIRSEFAKRILMNAIGIASCLSRGKKYASILDFSLSYLRSLPKSVSTSQRLKIGRIIIRNLGIYELVQKHDDDKRLIVLDEGTLHISHYLFVYEHLTPDIEQLEVFIGLVPFPDVVVHLSTPREKLIERTIIRGHDRINGTARTSVERFIEHALTVFEYLERSPEIKSRLIKTSPNKDIRHADGDKSPEISAVMGIIGSC